MTSDVDPLLRRLIGGDPEAPSEILDRARHESSPALLVAAALLCGDDTSRNDTDRDDVLTHAVACATTTRDRQLVAIAAAHLAGDEDLLDALVRDHLADHPDNVLAAWIAGLHTQPTHTQPTHTQPTDPTPTTRS